jgi:hypothetical protein
VTLRSVGSQSAALLSAMQGFTSGNYSYVFTAMYLALSDLPGQPGTSGSPPSDPLPMAVAQPRGMTRVVCVTADSADGYGLCSQNTASQSLSPRPSYNTFKSFPKGASAH